MYECLLISTNHAEGTNTNPMHVFSHLISITRTMLIQWRSTSMNLLKKIWRKWKWIFEQ